MLDSDVYRIRGRVQRSNVLRRFSGGDRFPRAWNAPSSKMAALKAERESVVPRKSKPRDPERVPGKGVEAFAPAPRRFHE